MKRLINWQMLWACTVSLRLISMTRSGRFIRVVLSSARYRNILYSYEKLIVIARSEIPRTLTLSLSIIGHCEKLSDEAISERARDRLRNLIKMSQNRIKDP
jgi:hypothetical protein